MLREDALPQRSSCNKYWYMILGISVGHRKPNKDNDTSVPDFLHFKFTGTRNSSLGISAAVANAI